jgi:hypothetical protein
MSLRINSDFNGVTDPDAGRYIAAVEAADGNQLLEFAVGKAINDFVVGCKQDRIWDAIKASCILAGARTLSGALVPLVGTAPTPVAFVSGDYNRKTGLIGDGSTKYLDANRANNADPQNSQHFSVYASSVGTSSPLGAYIGDLTSGQTGASYFYRDQATAGFLGASRIGAEFVGGTNSANIASFYAINRGAASSYSYRNKGASTSVTQASTTSTTGNINVFRVNRSTNNFNTNARLAFYSIGESLDLALLDARVTALITAFGVAIP